MSYVEVDKAVKYKVADLSLAAEGLGFTPQISVEEGLARSRAYYRATLGA